MAMLSIKSTFWDSHPGRQVKYYQAFWHFTEVLFLFLMNYFTEKEGFLLSCIVYIK
ncbi:hypothetical protein ES705_11999 [subsurface metagenome]